LATRQDIFSGSQTKKKNQDIFISVYFLKPSRVGMDILMLRVF